MMDLTVSMLEEQRQIVALKGGTTSGSRSQASEHNAPTTLRADLIDESLILRHFSRQFVRVNAHPLLCPRWGAAVVALLHDALLQHTTTNPFLAAFSITSIQQKNDKI